MNIRALPGPIEKNKIRISQGEIFYHPLLILPAKILNYSSWGHAVKISFKPEGILFHNSGEIIPNTDRLSRNIFRITSISDIIFKPKIKASEKTETKFREFFRTGEIETIRNFVDDITIVPPIDQLLEKGQPIIDLPIIISREIGIPGKYKYYTNNRVYRKIMEEGIIRAKRYQNRVARICLTTWSINPEQAFNSLFIGNPLYANKNKGSYVIGFDDPLDILILEKPNPYAEEYWYRKGNIRIEDVDLKFAGLNPVT